MDPVGMLFSGAMRRYQECFWTLAWIFLVPGVFLIVGQLLSESKSFAAVAAGGIVSFVGTLASLVASLAMVNALAHGTDFAASYRVGLKLFWAEVLIGILTILALIGGSVLLVVPGIMLGIALTFASYTLVVEDRHGMHALVASRKYVKGYWWAVVGRTLLLALIFIAMMALIYAPILTLLGRVAGAVVYLVLLVCYAPFSTCYTYGMYENLRRLKMEAVAAEGTGATGTGAAGTPVEVTKEKDTFLKICIVIGVIVALAIIIFVAIGARSGAFKPVSGDIRFQDYRGLQANISSS